jgi:hypothetical protein
VLKKRATHLSELLSKGTQLFVILWLDDIVVSVQFFQIYRVLHHIREFIEVLVEAL